MTFARPLLLVPLLLQTASPEAPQLTLGTTYASRVQAADPRADVSGVAPEVAPRLGRAKRFTLRTRSAGPYSFDLRSHHFDAFLIVRDAKGELVAATDDGGFGTHAALDALELEGAATYSVDACAPPDEGGEFTLLVRVGAAKTLSRAEEAEARLEDARERIFAVERRDGYVAPSLADACETHGALLSRLGRHREARASYERALGIREEYFGQESVEAARTKVLVADTYARSGDHETARARYDDAAALLKAAGETGAALRARLSSAESASALSDPGALDTLRALQTRTEAAGDESLRRDVDLAVGRELAARGELAAARLLLSDAPPSRPRDVELHAELRRVLGSADEAESQLALRVDDLESRLGRDHPATVDLLEALGDARFDAGRFEQAFEAYERAWLVRESLLGAEQPRLARAAIGAAAALAKLGDLESAAAQLELYLGGRAEPVPAEHPERLRAFANLARVELALGETREAAERIEAVRSTWIALAGDRTPDALDLSVDAALVALSSGDPEAAWWNARAALEVAGAHLDDELWALAPDDRIVMAEIVLRGLDALNTVLPLAARPERELFAYRSWLAWRASYLPALLASESVFTAGRSTEQWIHILRHRGLATQQRELLRAEHVPDLVLHVEQLADLRRRSGYLKWEYEILEGPPRSQPPPEILTVVDALPANSVLIDLATYRPWRPAVLEDGDLRTAASWGEPRLRAWLLRAGSPDVERFELGALSAPDESAASELSDSLESVGPAYVCPNARFEELLPAVLRDALPPETRVRLVPDPTFLSSDSQTSARGESRGLGTLGAPPGVVELYAEAFPDDDAGPEAWVLWQEGLRDAYSGSALDRWRVMQSANEGLLRFAPRDRLRPGLPRGVAFPTRTELPPGLEAYAPLAKLELVSVPTLIVRDAWPELLRVLHEAGAREVLVAPPGATDDELLDVLRAIWIDGSSSTEAADRVGWRTSGA